MRSRDIGKLCCFSEEQIYVFRNFWTIKFGQELDDNIYLDYLTEAGVYDIESSTVFGAGLSPPNLLYGISTIRLLKIANLITS